MGAGAGGGTFHEGLFRFFESHFGRARVALLGTDDLVGKAIREGQKRLTVDGGPSRWSHVFLFGERRASRRGPGGAVAPTPYIFESDLQIDLWRAQARNGAQESWLGKWCHDGVEHAAVLDLDPPAPAADAVLATALELVDEQVQYPVAGLLKTWFAIVTERTWIAAPEGEPHALYCSSFARHCWREAGRDFLPAGLALSHTAPEHIARAAPLRGEWRR